MEYASGRSGPAYLTCSSLQAAIELHVLPRLALSDLAKLACTCTCLRSTVYQQDSIWRQAACVRLPALQWQLQFVDRTGVQHVMQRRLTAFDNMMLHEAGSALVIDVSSHGFNLPWFSFSPDAQRLAICSGLEPPSELAMYDTASGAPIWKSSIEVVLESVGLLSSSVQEQSAAFDLAWAPTSKSLIALHQKFQASASAQTATRTQLLLIDGKTGYARLGHAYEPDLLAVRTSFDNDPSLMFFHEPSFSHNASLLCLVTYGMVDGSDVCAQLSIMDIDSGTTIISALECDSESSHGACWSHTNELLVCAGHLINTVECSVTKLVGSRWVSHAVFDDSAQRLGFVRLDQEGAGGAADTAAVVLDVESLDVLLSVPGCGIAGFFRNNDWVLISSSPLIFGAWNLCLRHQMFSVSVDSSHWALPAVVLSKDACPDTLHLEFPVRCCWDVGCWNNLVSIGSEDIERSNDECQFAYMDKAGACITIVSWV